MATLRVPKVSLLTDNNNNNNNNNDNNKTNNKTFLLRLALNFNNLYKALRKKNTKYNDS